MTKTRPLAWHYRINRQRVSTGLLMIAGLLIAGCSGTPVNMLDARGPAAASIAELWWVMFILGAAVFLLVVGIVLAIVLKRRSQADTDTGLQRPDGRDTRWIMIGGIVMPLIVLAVVFGFTMRSMAGLSSDEGELTIEVIGRRWWWEVNYRDLGITTANQIHIPVGVPVDIVLQSGDVIHSFWVPQLHGKMDAIPGRVNRLQIQADEAGEYRGECGEFCGIQHTHMGFVVVAQSAEAFDSWVASEQQPAAQPDDLLAVRGQEVFASAGCVYCHTIRGVDFSSIDASAVDLGPDLTHFASRLTLGAGILPNNRGNLSGWIANPQHIKPGVLMPASALSGDDLQALLAYLETLH